MSKPILCLDFDGVIHAYTSPWTDALTISDGPVPGALEWMLSATAFFNITIYSSRSKVEGGASTMRNWLYIEARKLWSDERVQLLSKSIEFAHEKPPAFLTIDDRALCFHGDWSVIDPKQLLKFKPWNKQLQPVVNKDEPAPRDDGTMRKAHYGEGKQPWDTIKEKGWAAQFAAGNVVKYLRRDKDRDHSIAAARWYWDALKTMMRPPLRPELGWNEHSEKVTKVWFQLIEELTTEEKFSLTY